MQISFESDTRLVFEDERMADQQKEPEVVGSFCPRRNGDTIDFSGGMMLSQDGTVCLVVRAS